MHLYKCVHFYCNTHSHTHSQLRELQAEKQILEQQRDIANKEREKMITDNVQFRKKLETIKIQRQKDAKDLSAMRHVKDKALTGVCVCLCVDLSNVCIRVHVHAIVLAHTI